MTEIEIEYGVRYLGHDDAGGRAPFVEQCSGEAEARARHEMRLRRDETAKVVTREVTTAWTDWSDQPGDQEGAGT